jgi:hypothetical protein
MKAIAIILVSAVLAASLSGCSSSPHRLSFPEGTFDQRKGGSRISLGAQKLDTRAEADPWMRGYGNCRVGGPFCSQ